MRNIIFKVIVNLITSLRLIGAIMLPYLINHLSVRTISITAIILFLTDSLDGFLARKLNVSTFFGALLDVVCDKSLSIVSFIVLSTFNKIFYIPLVLELVIILVNVIKYKEGFDVVVNIFGKIKTAILSVTVIMCFTVLSFTDLSNIINNTQTDFLEISMIVLIISQIIVVINYFVGIIKNPKFIIEKFSKEERRIPNRHEIKFMLFDHDFYIKNKRAPIKELLYTKK